MLARHDTALYFIPLNSLVSAFVADTRIPVRVRYDEPSEDSAGFEAYQAS